MYYHIRIDYIDPKLKVNQTRFSYDMVDINDVRKIAASYLSDSPFIFEGVKLHADDVRTMEIFESKPNITVCIDLGDKELNSPWFKYNKTNIFEREDLLCNITRTLFDDLVNGTVNDSVKETATTSLQPEQSKNVFIVHGHDTLLRTEVEMMITQLGYNPIVLFKEADKGQTIIEKLESKSSEVVFCIVLYTACDKGCAKNQNELKSRARQNVVFEHGMMCAKLGRERVVALLEDGVEMPGDLSGVIYKEIDSHGRWKYDVAREMQEVGLDVDLNKIR